MKKKIAMLLLSASLAASLAACSNSSSSQSASTQATAESAEAAASTEAAAEGDTSAAVPGVTIEQFNQLENGMTLSEVQELFGSEGTIITTIDNDNLQAEIYMWPGEKEDSEVQAEIVDGEVVTFEQFGLE